MQNSTHLHLRPLKSRNSTVQQNFLWKKLRWGFIQNFSWNWSLYRVPKTAYAGVACYGQLLPGSKHKNIHLPVLRPYSCRQKQRLEAWIHKIKRFVWICSPKPQPCFIAFADCSRIRERSFPFLETTYTVACSNLSLAVTAIVFSFYNNIVICLPTKHVGALRLVFEEIGKPSFGRKPFGARERSNY